MNLTKSLIAIFALALCAPALLGQTAISADITTDTTWNNAGSPYEINTGGDFHVNSDATLTIDTTSGNVDVDWLDGATFDFIVTEGATLVIKAASGSATFGMTSASNIRITSTGRITWLDDTGSTTFTRLNSGNEPGALIFEANQSRQSEIKNAVFSYMGNDGRDGAIVVEDNGTLPPLLEGLSFSDCTTSAVRFDGKGINTLRQDGLKPPFSVTNTDYVFFLNAVISTVPIRFPDPSTPTSPFALLSGTCEVGDGSNVSHWRFDAAYTFHCATSSEIEVVRGSIWGTAEAKPTFRHPNPTTGTPGWVGLRDEQSGTANVFGGLAAFAHIQVRDAIEGVLLSKSNAYVGLTVRLEGIQAHHCSTGIRAIANSGTLTISNCEAGGSTSAEECFLRCIRVSSDVNAVFYLKDCHILGAKPNSGTGVWTTFSPTCIIEDCRFSGNGSAAVQANNGSNVTVRDTLIVGSWSYGVYAFATTSSHTQLLMERSSIGGIVKGLELVTAATGKISARVLNSTLIGSTNAGAVINAGSTLHGIEFERCIFSGCVYGVHLVDDSDNLVTPEFIECQFTSNSYGIYDARTHASHAVAYHCSFLANSTYGAFDAEGSEELIAQDCYWGHPDGPTEPSGPTLGDEVNQYVDVQPPLSVPYIGWLIGGSSAGPSLFEVGETSALLADRLHVVEADPYFIWEFASDFAGATQSAYQVQVSTSLSFGTPVWDSTKIVSGSSSVQCGTSLTAGDFFFARIKLWDQHDIPGPWYHLTFRRNTAPGTVDNTGRAPADNSVTPINDWTPEFVWQTPLDDEYDPLHFEVLVSRGAAEYTVRSWTLSEDAHGNEFDFRAQFQMSFDDGGTWIPFAQVGAPIIDPPPLSGQPKGKVRLAWPNEFALADTGGTPWAWTVRACDGYEFGTASDEWEFALAREYTVAGTLTNTVSGKTIRLRHNGNLISDATTDGSGNFELDSISAPLLAGDVLVAYISGDTEKGARVFRFAGSDMGGLELTFGKAFVGVIGDESRYVEADFAQDSSVDSDIPWSYNSGTVTFSNALEGAFLGIWIESLLDVTGTVECAHSSEVNVEIRPTGRLRVRGGTIACYQVTINAGSTLEARNGSMFRVSGPESVNRGNLMLYDSTLEFEAESSLLLRIQRGVFDVQRSTVESTNSTHVSEVIVEEFFLPDVGALACHSTTFDSVRITIGEHGILALFNDNIFQGTVDVKHIEWLTENPLSAGEMRGISFNSALSQSSTYNILASEESRMLRMIGCGGTGWGPVYEDDFYDRVEWERTPPAGLKLSAGDTRVRAEWEPDDQTDSAALGFNLYKSPIMDGFWTSAPTYSGGSNRTTFTNSAADFTSALVGLTFYPDATSTATLTVLAVPSSTTIEVTGDETGAADDDDRYSFFVKINGSLLAVTNEVATGLTNDESYWFYVTVDDSTEDAPADRVRSAFVRATPRDPDVEEVAPSSAPASGALALTILGSETHWTSAVDVAITKGGGTGVTVNDKLQISASLVLVDATLTAASTGSWTVTVSEDDVWGVSAYDEEVSGALVVEADPADDSGRPSIAFTTSNGGVASDADTSGAFIVNLAYSDNGNGVTYSNLELYASREVDIAGTPVGSGTDLVSAGLDSYIAVQSSTETAFDILQIAGNVLFEPGEYTLTARVPDSAGIFSEMASIRFYVEGGDPDVIKVSGSVHLLQGSTVNVTLTGDGLSYTETIDFGSGIQVNSASGNGSSISVNLTVDQLAACGPREFTTNDGAKTGIAVVEYPSSILPTPGATEPPRNAAVAGVNVFLKNGAFFKGETDIATRGRMMGLSWSRFYRSDMTYNGPLGQKWVGHYFQRVRVNGSNDIEWFTPDGRKETFPDVSGGYSNPAGVYVTATRETTHHTITLTDRHGFRCVFNSDGRLWKCIDRNGNVSVCAYNHARQLVRIVDDRGKAWEIAYHDHGRVENVRDKVWDTSSPREVEYAYDSEGNLIRQKAPETDRYNDTNSSRLTYAYRYDSQHRMIACINPREFNESSEPVAYFEIVYDSQGRVTDQKLGDEADVVDGHIPKSSFLRLRYVSSTLIREIDRAGHRTDYTIDATGRATDVKRYTAFWSVDTDIPIDHSAVTQALAKSRSGDPSYFQSVFTYNSNHEVLTTTHPRGNKTT